MSWMSKRNAAKREAQRVKDTADIMAEGWAPPLTAHDARMATGEDGCNSPGHDHSRELTDAEVDAALYAQQKDPVPEASQGGEVGYYEPGGEGERRAKAFWDHGLPPVEEFEREIYTRLDAGTGRSWTANRASPREWTYEEVNGQTAGIPPSVPDTSGGMDSETVAVIGEWARQRSLEAE
jgi:hypothetical protein